MTAPIDPVKEGASRWTAQTVGMSWDILDRMEQAVAKVREIPGTPATCFVQGPWNADITSLK